MSEKARDVMEVFSRDVDLLLYEPVLFGDLRAESQVLSEGEGALSAGVLTDTGADFSSMLAAGDVVWMSLNDGSAAGAFEIVSVDSGTQLSVSVVRAPDGDAVAPVMEGAVSYRVCSYQVQAYEAAMELAEYFGIRPARSLSEIETVDLVDTQSLRRASMFAVLANVYASLACESDGDIFWKKNVYYRGLFVRARERCKLNVDTDGDGEAERELRGGELRLRRR